jgi:hypothetical protein
MDQIENIWGVGPAVPYRLRRTVRVGLALMMSLAGVAFATPACTVNNIESDEDDDGGSGDGTRGGTGGNGSAGDNAGKGGNSGAAGEGRGGAEGGSPGAAGADEPGGAAGSGGDGAPLSSVPVPPAVVDGNVQVSCTVSCEAAANCTTPNVYVSACAEDQPGLCYDITPIDDPAGGGNTYIVSIDANGQEDVIEGAECQAADVGDDALPVDILFVIDTTSSMENAIDGIVASIDSFVGTLAARGVDARIGAIAFGDDAPLPDCVAPEAPFAAFTDKFGAGSESDPESFNYWLSNLGASHCGDAGGDSPENALDAIEFALGNDPLPSDAFPADAFAWNPEALHVIEVITDVPQHELGDGYDIAHFDLEQVKADLDAFAVVHVVGPNYGCYNTPMAGCECNVSDGCDTGCACDISCPTPGCADDVNTGLCDSATSVCDRDCAGFGGSSCDVTVDVCDAASAGGTAPCADDVDCVGTAAVGAESDRRCAPESQAPYIDIGELTLATGGAFTTLPEDGSVDLTKLPLGGVIVATERCTGALPPDTRAVRCVYVDADGNEGEVIVELGPTP